MMRRVNLLGVVAVAAVIAVGAARATAQHADPAKPHASAHVMVNAADVKWGAAPPALPAGAQMAVLEGDPGKAGEQFAIRAKLPDGYAVPPHWHPTDEHIVVLSGTLMVGLGDKVTESSMHALTAGAFARMPRKTNHYVKAKGETIFQVYGVGPFELNYVDPKDDPRNKATK